MELKGKRVLVTGGAGFIGSHLVQRLAQDNHVRILDDLSNGKLSNISDVDAEFIQGSVLDQSVVDDMVTGCDLVFHLAAVASVERSVKEPVFVLRTNLEGSLNVFQACMRHDAKVVFSSSSAVYGETEGPNTEDMPVNPISPYGIQKAAAEQLIRSFHPQLRGVSLRYFNVFGPRQDPASNYAAVVPVFLTRIKEGKTLTVFGDGHQTRDMCYVSNVVDANIAAALSDVQDGRVYNIATGSSVEIIELIETMFTVTGKRVEIDHGPQRAGDIKHSSADIALAQKELGFRPEVDLGEGLRTSARWFDV